LDQYTKPGQVIVSVTHAFASRWLLPRLTGFRARHPDLDVWLHTSDRMLDFERGEVHASVWLGDGKWPGLEVAKLFDEELVPVCAPALLRHRPSIAAAVDMLDFTLLHDERREDWRTWFAKEGFKESPPVAGPNFSDSGLLLQAAADGQGIALGSLLLAADDLAAGRLIIAWDRRLKSKLSYFLVCSDTNLARPTIRTFHDWLISEAAIYRRAGKSPASSVIVLDRRSGRRGRT
jgi:LysR family glycine cleavage system transcriptional activator